MVSSFWIFHFSSSSSNIFSDGVPNIQEHAISLILIGIGVSIE